MTDKNNAYIVYSSWEKNNRRGKATAIWKALSASHAGERHRKAFPAENIDKIRPVNAL
jgi:hypothetical protein